MVYQTPRLTLLSLLTAVFLLGFAPVSALDFTWPANTVQCGIIPMNITGGSPPYTFNILPVDGQVFSWNLLEPISGKWINETWNVQLQLAAGTAYVAYLSHSGNVGQGGITPIQVVGSSSDPLCLSTAASNYTSNLFSMSLTGLPSPTECDTSLRIGHDGSSASAPYNYTIIPLDGGYKPWTAAFPDGQSSVDVNVNMTAGSRFTVFLSNKLYWGGAQSGKIYTVNNSTSGSITCEAQPYAPPMGYSWPASLLSTTLPIADDYAPTGSPGNSTTSSSTSTSGTAIPSDNSNNSPKPSGLSTGAMAGIGAGIGCLALAGIGAFIWWLLRRKRVRHPRKGDQRGYEAAGEKSSRFDMLSPPKHAHTDSFGPHKDGAGGEEGDEPRVEPFRSHSDYARASLPVQAYAAGLALPIPGPGGLGSVGAGGLSSPNQIGSSEAGQTDYNTVETVQHAAFPVPMPMTPPTDSNAAVGRELDAMSDTGSDGLSRGPTGTAFYYIPPAGASGSAVDIARSASHTLYNDQGQGQGQGIGQGPLQGLLPPGSMIRGPVSAAAEKARLSAQYAQMDSNGVPNAAPPSSSSPFASPSTPAAPIGLQQQAHLAASASQIDLPAPQHVAHPAQNQVSVISPSSAAVESHQGHIHAQQQNNGGGEGAIYRRHMDGGEMQDENRPDVGEVELPPLYEDVPARRV